jgi:hypothetical protein
MATTVKVSTETRDRIKSFGGATLEETIVAALDALDEQRFWAQAEAAAAALRALPPDEITRRKAAEDAVDRAFDGIG